MPYPPKHHRRHCGRLRPLTQQQRFARAVKNARRGRALLARPVPTARA